MNDYEIVIIGAGPAGAMAALNSKKDTLLIEKKKKIGVPIHCGEGLSSKIVDQFNLHKYIKNANTVSNVEFNFPNGKERTIRLHSLKAYVMDKDVFLQGIVEDAVKNKNVEVRTNTFARYKNGKIVLSSPPLRKGYRHKKEEVTGKVIIAADGTNSGVGRSVGLTKPLKPEDVHVCAQYKLKGDFDPCSIRLFMDEVYAPSGYVWVFPKNEHIANVGLGIQGSRHLNVKQYLEWFIRDHYPHAEKKDFFTAPLSLASPVENCRKDNILLVGESARFVISPSGAGIGNALLSGKTASEVATEYLDGKCGLMAYPHKMYLNLYSKLKRAYKFKKKLMEDGGVKHFYRIVIPLFYMHKIFPNMCEKFAMKNLRF